MYNPRMWSAREAPFNSGTLICGMLGALLAVLVLPPAGLAVPVDEHHRYAISLWGIPAGEATINVEEVVSDDDRSLRRLVTTARSNDFISIFFPVENYAESIIDAQTLLPQQLIFQRREGSRHEDFDIRFDHVVNQVTLQKNGQPSVHSIVPGTHDILSCLYFLRTMPTLEPGSSVQLNIYHDRKNYQVDVHVEAVEPVAGSWGTVEAIRLLAVMPFRGIFLNEGNIRFWLTNTEERIPVMMEARVIVGSVRAMLEGWAP
ncbi:MAG: DUF3108 domain-containing protein [Nitrospira sp.]|nr:DUF3108 domain-containing protein [Nitrospira sp.]